MTAPLATDVRHLGALKLQASTDPKAAAREAAKQFEALFMQELMKSMRAATISSGMLDNEASKLGQEMLDQQFATQLTGMPGGLADAIARQLERQMGGASAPRVDGLALPARSAATVARAAAAPAAAAGAPPAFQNHQVAFIDTMSAAARSAETKTGIPAEYMVAQAAHESGWGRHEIRNADGSTSHNVFGIKATGGWSGKVAEVTTTEYIDGAPRKVVAKFRAYDSYREAFDDYARLMTNSPRYSGVLANADTPEGFARGLQRAGYATDPAYARKLTNMINTTLRVQRSYGDAGVRTG